MRRAKSTEVHPFQRLQSELSELISRTPAGSRLPAEPELAKQLGVSRATLREAMRTFEGQGLIRRRQGVGTFVTANSSIVSGLETLQSIQALAQQAGLDVEMGDHTFATVTADLEESEALKVKEGEQLLRVARVISAGGRPVAYLVDTLPEDVLRESELDNEFSGSVLDFLLRRGEPKLSTSLAEIKAVAAPGEIARALEIQRGDVLLLFVARLLDVDGRVVDYSHSYFLPGTFQFQIVRQVGKL